MTNATAGSDTRQPSVNPDDKIVIRPLRGRFDAGRRWVWFSDLHIIGVDAALDEAGRGRAVDEAFAEIRAGVVWQGAPGTLS